MITGTTIMNTPLRILFLGATGYIGGAVLDRLLEHPARHSYEIVSYSRNAEKAKKLEELFDVKTVIGTLDDSDKIEEQAALADVVIHTADSADHMGSVQAILRGAKRKFQQSGQVPIYIHTSGTGLLIDQAKGEHDNHTTYDDTNIEQLKSIPESAIHHVVDLAVLAADEEGYVRTYIVLPSTIYGLADGPVFKAGLANPISQQVPQLIRGGLGRGRAGTIGKGKNVWPHVHINDIANLFATIFNALQGETERVGHGWEGFYFGENGHYNFGELGHAIGKYLVKIGKAKEETPVPFTKEEIDKYFNGSEYLGSNSRCVATRGRKLGWRPRYTTEDFYADVAAETDYILAHQQ